VRPLEMTNSEMEDFVKRSKGLPRNKTNMRLLVRVFFSLLFRAFRFVLWVCVVVVCLHKLHLVS